MAASRSGRILRGLGYATLAGGVGAGTLYFVYRPRDVPGLEAASVPPPTYGEGGVFRPPQFPRIKSRAEQIADLKRSAGAVFQEAKEKVKNTLGIEQESAGADDNVYDLLIIGGGATGSGIALDAASRGLKVACVERDDFASGTSSKSTKLVHGGVRYLASGQLSLVYEALHERRVMLQNAPHLVSKNCQQHSR